MFRKLLTKSLTYAPDEPPAGGVVPAAEPVEPVVPAAEPAAEPSEPVEPAEPANVPLSALKDERKKRQDAEKEAQRLREQNAYYEGMRAAAPPTVVAQVTPAAPAGPPAPPKVEDFDSFEDFQTADRQHIINVAKYEARQEFEQGQTTRHQQETIATQVRTFQERVTKAAELDPELPVLVATFHLPGPNHVPLTDAMQDAIRESEVGPQLLRYFANNKAEATRLASLSPTSALREVGRIEAALINKPTPPVKHVTSAPEPIKPVGSGGSVEIDEDKMPMTEYLARERQKKDALRQQRR